MYTNHPINGFSDLFGSDVQRRKYLEVVFANIARSYGFADFEMPIVEHASSFDEKIVGESPWPEWDKRGCLYMRVNDYPNSYNDEPDEVSALLIPEGTISVTRWLGSMIDKSAIALPAKIFYCSPCFRNELISELTDVKGRQFNQFGLEVLGASSEVADCEVLWLALSMLENAGIQRTLIKPRISDISIFSNLVVECNINHEDSIRLKECLDTIAECNAGKKPERHGSAQNEFFSVLDSYQVSGPDRFLWEILSSNPNSYDRSSLIEHFPKSYHEAIERLFRFRNEFSNLGFQPIVDLAVVRSHEYYTGLSFELDVVSDTMRYVEIAGGGRYDKLVENFVRDGASRVPCTGFAFGMERVLSCLTGFGQLNETLSTQALFYGGEATADSVAGLAQSSVEGYVNSLSSLSSLRATGERIDVFPLESGSASELEQYVCRTGAKKVIEQ